MKFLHFSMIVLLSLTFCLTSCEKENIAPNTSTQIETADDLGKTVRPGKRTAQGPKIEVDYIQVNWTQVTIDVKAATHSFFNETHGGLVYTFTNTSTNYTFTYTSDQEVNTFSIGECGNYNLVITNLSGTVVSDTFPMYLQFSDPYAC